jgi:hypothetical protein
MIGLARDSCDKSSPLVYRLSIRGCPTINKLVRLQDRALRAHSLPKSPVPADGRLTTYRAAEKRLRYLLAALTLARSLRHVVIVIVMVVVMS